MIETNCLKLYTIDPDKSLGIDKSLRIVFPVYFVYDFQQKYSLCYTLLTDQISLPGCFYFLKYWAICVL